MKTFKNTKGFTLIELLAVIVVLAIVMAIAVTSVLPAMTSARKEAFALEANNAMETASNILSLYNLGILDKPGKGTDYQEGNNKYCFSLKYLSETGYLDKKSEYFAGDTPEYAGKVIVETSGDGMTGKYTYTITMHNNLYKVTNIKGSVDSKKTTIDNYASSEAKTAYECAATDVSA